MLCPRCDKLPTDIRATDLNEALRESIHPDEAGEIRIRPIYQYTARHLNGSACILTEDEFYAMASDLQRA